MVTAIAVIKGISYFKQERFRALRDQIRTDAVEFAMEIQAYEKRPYSVGGGGNYRMVLANGYFPRSRPDQHPNQGVLRRTQNACLFITYAYPAGFNVNAFFVWNNECTVNNPYIGTMYVKDQNTKPDDYNWYYMGFLYDPFSVSAMHHWMTFYNSGGW